MMNAEPAPSEDPPSRVVPPVAEPADCGRRSSLIPGQALASVIDEFVSAISHDLKGPLLNFQGFLRRLATACKALHSLAENLPPERRANWEQVYQEKVQSSLQVLDENARRMGDYLQGKISGWRERHKIVGDIRGKGLMIGVELVLDKKTKARAHDLRDKVVDLAFEKGLLLLGAGENTVRLAPPLLIDEEQSEFAVKTLEACITEVEKTV